jgi:beta-1,4-mannosyl-glycoprotein beta-1,4-N-acetylglucosaminyltransferase
MVKVIDVFPFYNELEMLDFRLAELYDVVDHFVIVEAAHTYVGNPKPYYYEENQERYAKYKDKIIHIKVADMPNTGDPWINEEHQRDCGIWGILEVPGLDERDIVISTDCDEVMNSNSIRQFKFMIEQNNLTDYLYNLKMVLYYYNLENKRDEYWDMGKIMSYKSLCGNNGKLHFVRTRPTLLNMYIETLPRCGWHFSYFGTPDAIRNKIQNFSHQEFNNIKYTDVDKIASKINESRDLFPTSIKWSRTEIAANDYLPNNWRILEKIGN